MQSAIPERPVRLTVPACPSMLLIVRLTTAGVMARAGLSVDALEDMKLAVEEACNCVVQNSGCGELRLEFLLGREALTVRVEGSGATCKTNWPQENELHVIRCILESMADGVDILRSGETLGCITLSKKLPA